MAGKLLPDTHLHLVNEQGELILFAVILYIGKLLW